jgi:error-prone DNA polymerase
MGFYAPAVLVSDARRHGLRVKPIDVQISEWPCTLEHESDGSFSLRLGMGYARGLRRQIAEALVTARLRDGVFSSAEDLALRVPLLNRKELTLLARIGALNGIDEIEHRRDALWQVERAGKPEGPLLRQQSEWLHDATERLPLQSMTDTERLIADYSGTGLTVGRHPMQYRRETLRAHGILAAADLQKKPNGAWVRSAGCVIARQRPGTAKGFLFISMEDESGITNVIVSPNLFEQERLVVTRSRFLLVEGPLQNQNGVVHIRAKRLAPLSDQAIDVRSHDFH